MSEERLQRYDLISPSEWECAGMGESDTGEWVGYEPWMDDAEAEIAGLREREKELLLVIASYNKALCESGKGQPSSKDAPDG